MKTSDSKSSRSNKLGRFLIFALVIVFTSSGVVLSGFWRDKSSIKKIELKGNTTLSKEEIFEFAKLSDSLLMSNKLSLQVIEDRISKHPGIKKVNASRESSLLTIEIFEKAPFATVILFKSLDNSDAKNDKSIFLIDDELNLYIFKKENKNINLPVISGLSGIRDINNFSEDDYNKLKLARFIINQMINIDKFLYNYISEINFLDSTGVVLYTFDDAVPVYLIDFKEYKNFNNEYFYSKIREKLVYLNNFLKQVALYKSRNSFTSVDLRYQDIVVVKNNEK